MTYYLINQDIVFDNASGKIVHVHQKETQQLKSNEWKLLHLFVANPGIDISADHILNSVWDGKRAKSSVATSIKNLRKLLGDSADTPRFIQTQVMKGYALIADVALLDESELKSTLRKHRSTQTKAAQWCLKRRGSLMLYAINVVCAVSLLFSLSSMFQHGMFDSWLPTREIPTEWQPMVIKGSLGQDALNYTACESLLSDARATHRLNQIEVSALTPPQRLPSLTWADDNKKVLLCHLSSTE
ncbi:winged helix-turn-helix domain-containing protein [Enterovibrio calviensis]|uniref:winged helix-turn-helix domain-containing protein n=1 Tax=Enterovibrio calviensis TaxID=91359 RepID=UPI000489635B|nr:winged helix-turn-helix domain-containing protein [Enterovibrio calviensis]